MSFRERIRRPTLERKQPIRSWPALFGGLGAESGPSLSDVVSRSVDLGYRVVDEYVRQGQKAAQRISDRSYGPDAVTGDLQDVMARMAQYTSDFLGLWFDFMQLAWAGNAWPWAGGARDGARAPSRAPGAPADRDTRLHAEALEHTRVRIEVASAQPTEVSLDLRPQATGRRLVVHALRTVDPAKPKLTEVAFETGSGDEPARLRVRVPRDQPAGIYSGVIVDEETSRPAGTLSVRVSPE